jgi:hypothetical protein
MPLDVFMRQLQTAFKLHLEANEALEVMHVLSKDPECPSLQPELFSKFFLELGEALINLFVLLLVKWLYEQEPTSPQASRRKPGGRSSGLSDRPGGTRRGGYVQR